MDGLFHDFAFLTPAPVTVPPGQTAIVPVAGKLTGPAAAGINFALTRVDHRAGRHRPHERADAGASG